MSDAKFGANRPATGAPNRRAVVAALLAGLPLAACGGGAPVESFDLSAPKEPGVSRAPRGQLVIIEPVATSPTDSDRIIVRPTPDTVATLKGAQWVERLPRLVQTRLVQTFENARMLRSVGRPDAKIQADYALESEIRRFEIDVGEGQAVVEISAKLVAEGSGRIKAAKIFSARVQGAASEGAAAARALDEALTQAMRKIVAWTASNV